jgi:glycosyltransferase involved in cell wall biosynthesis
VSRTRDVSVIIPARNEAASIGRCLQAIADQDYPRDLIEVILVEAGSTDNTVAVAQSEADRVGLSRFRIVSCPQGTTPDNLNRGLAVARGEILCRVDARSFLPADYLRRCVDVLDSRPEVAVVGGAQIAVAPRPGPVGVGIARALNNRYGMGLSRYRSGRASGPADTVYLGAFRTEQLRREGGWDSRFATNQDFELNRRMADQGLVWFEASLRVDYAPRPSLKLLFAQYQRFGRSKTRYWQATGDRPQPRQLVLLTSPVIGLAVTAWLRRRILVPAVAGAVAVEVAGAREPQSGSLVAHATAVAALAAVAAGWVSGVVLEAVWPERG